VTRNEAAKTSSLNGSTGSKRKF